MNVVLVAPPVGSLAQPCLSLPSLTAALRAAGHHVVQRDVGMAALDMLLEPQGMLGTRARLLERLDQTVTAPEKPSRGDHDRGLEPEAALVIAAFVAEQIAEAKAILRTPELFYDVQSYTFAVNVVRRAFEVVSAAFSPFRITLSGVSHGCRTTYADARRLALDDDADPLAALLRDEVMPRLLADDAGVLGISATYSRQLIPAFQLARIAKIVSPGTRVVLGGSAITLAQTRLRQEERCFEWVDAYVFGEGESALLRLVDAIAGDVSAPLPARVYMAPGLVSACGCRFDESHERDDFGTLPCPDYEGLNYGDYLSPEPVFLLSNGRGCYHRRCAFCNVSLSYMDEFKQRPLASVVSDIKSLNQQHGVRHVFFADDCIPPKRCEQIAAVIRDLPEAISWATEVRFESSLTRAALDGLRAGGCRSLIFGSESASQRVLDLMNKGTRLETGERVIDDASAAGIAVHLQNFVGFPGESVAEAGETVDFLVSARDRVTSTALAEYEVTEFSPVHRDPARFGVRNLRRRGTADLIPSFVFAADHRLSKGIRDRFFHAAVARLLRAYPYHERFLDGPLGAHSLLFLSKLEASRFDDIFGPGERTIDDFARCRPALDPHTVALPHGRGRILFNPDNASRATLPSRDWAWVKRIDGAIPVGRLCFETWRGAPGPVPERSFQEHSARLAVMLLDLAATGLLSLRDPGD